MALSEFAVVDLSVSDRHDAASSKADQEAPITSEPDGG
jgi:hypothetical protein